MAKITVVGCGVSGLTTAVALREAGYEAHIIAADLPPDTTSVVAAAVWTASFSGPGTRAFAWGVRSRAVFENLARDPTTGVAPLRHRQLEVTDADAGGWQDEYPWIRRLHPDEVPAGYASGWLINGFRIHPLVYLDWLRRRFESLGGTVSVRRLTSLEDAEDPVVNCAGLGARSLCADVELVPVRGQVVVVRNAGIDEAISDENDLDRVAYIYPRNDEVILGGTRQTGDWNLQPDRATTERILIDTRRLDPRLSGVEVLAVRVGLRPGRPEVRLERSRLRDGRSVIHNYGHGGKGYILSWGCAEEVVTLGRLL